MKYIQKKLGYIFLGTTAIILTGFFVSNYLPVFAQEAVDESIISRVLSGSAVYRVIARSVLALPICNAGSDSGGKICFAGKCISLSSWKDVLGGNVKDFRDSDCDDVKNYQDECPSENDQGNKGSQYAGCSVEKPSIINGRFDNGAVKWEVGGDTANVIVTNTSGQVVWSQSKSTRGLAPYSYPVEVAQVQDYIIQIENTSRNVSTSQRVVASDVRYTRDTDGDGVFDINDTCPNSPAPGTKTGCLHATFTSTDYKYDWLDPAMSTESTLRGNYFMLDVAMKDAWKLETDLFYDNGVATDYGQAKVYRKYCNDSGFSNQGISTQVGKYCRIYILPPLYTRTTERYHANSATLQVSIQGEDGGWERGHFRMGMQNVGFSMCFVPEVSCGSSNDGGKYVCGDHEEGRCDDVVSDDAGSIALDLVCKGDPFRSFQGRYVRKINCKETCTNFPGLRGNGDCINNSQYKKK